MDPDHRPPRSGAPGQDPAEDAAPAPGAAGAADEGHGPPPLPRPRAATFLLALVALYPVGQALQLFQPAAGLVWTQLFVFALPAAALAARAGLAPLPFLGLRRPPPRTLGLALAVGLAAVLAGGGLQALWASALPAHVVELFDVTRLFRRPPWERAALVATAVVLAPVCEELAFRGHLLTALRLRRSPWAAMALSALAFALMHLDPVRLPGLLFLGALFAWLAWRSGSLLPAVVAHAANNAVAAAVALGALGLPEEEAPRPPEPLAAAVTLLAGAALLWPLLQAYGRAAGEPLPAEANTLASGRPAGRWPRWVMAAALLAVLAGAAAVASGR